MKNSPWLIVGLLLTFAISKGQDYGYGQFIESSDTLNYRILYPAKFDENKAYPVLLFLHGAGERGADNEKQLVHGSRLFLDAQFRNEFPAIVIFPQCPQDDYWSNVKIDRQVKPIDFKYKKGGKPTSAMKLVISMMDSLVNTKVAKSDQIYVGGLSMGGMGTFEILSRRPEMFAAAFPICGGGHPKNASKYGSNTAVWVFHGAKDDVVLPRYSTAMVLALQEAGGEVRYNLYPNANHNSWDAAFVESELFSWLFNHSKLNN